MPPGTSRLRIIVDASTDAGRAELKQMVAELKGAGAATDALSATQNKLALALAETQAAAGRLSDAQRALSAATDPDEQTRLALEVSKAQVALDREAAEVDQLTTELDQLNREAASAAGGQGKLARESQNVIGTFTEISSVINIAQQGYAALQGVYRAVIQETIDLAKQTRDLARTIGSTPEEASKLIQVADDVLISYETLTSAFEAGIRQGVEPTVDGLAKISEEFLALPPGIERSRFAMDKFGRSGNDLQPLLELGSERIHAMGEEAEALGLVMDDAMIKKARDAELAMDAFGDAVLAVKIALAGGAIPAVTLFTNAWAEKITVLTQGTKALREGRLGALEFAETLFRSFTPAVFFGAGELDELNKKIDEDADVVAVAEDRWDGLAQQLGVATEAETKLAAAAARTALRLESQDGYTRALAGHTYEVKLGMDGMTSSMDLLHAAMNGAVGQELRSYEESQSDLETQIADTRAELEKYSNLHGTVARNDIDGAEATRQLTIAQAAAETAARGLAEAQQELADNTDPDKQLQLEAAVARAEGGFIKAQGAVGEWDAKLSESGGTYVVDYTTKLGEIQTRLGELEGEYDANATAHEEATRRILFSILEQEIAQSNLVNHVDGSTAEERTLLDEQEQMLRDLALEWGLVDQATYDATTNIMDSVAKAAADGNWDLVRRHLQGIDADIRNIPTTWDITVTTTYRTEQLDQAPRGAADTSGDYFDAPSDAPGSTPTVYMPPEPPPDGMGGAHGLSLDVPPGYPNDSFGPIWAQSGEHVEITPGGRPHGGGQTIINIDARGASDPAAVELAGYRGAQRALAELGASADARIRLGLR